MKKVVLAIFILDETGIAGYVLISEDPSIESNYEEIQKVIKQIP
jgi:hypothetical protein